MVGIYLRESLPLYPWATNRQPEISALVLVLIMAKIRLQGLDPIGKFAVLSTQWKPANYRGVWEMRLSLEKFYHWPGLRDIFRKSCNFCGMVAETAVVAENLKQSYPRGARIPMSSAYHAHLTAKYGPCRPSVTRCSQTNPAWSLIMICLTAIFQSTAFIRSQHNLIRAPSAPGRALTSSLVLRRQPD